MSTAAKVAQSKAKHPERYCPTNGCLWRTNGEHCPRHATPSIERQTIIFLKNHAEVMRMSREMAGAMILNAVIRHLEAAL
jgi:hypothetical protein